MTKSIEDRKVFAALAVAIANVLDSGQCPSQLTEVLLETVDPLSELLTPATPCALSVLQLRTLAGLAKARDRERPEAETLATAKSHAKAATLNGASGK